MLQPRFRSILPSESSGFSLLEVIASLAIISIALAALAPTLVLAAATRIYTQQTEGATNLAYQELDRVRATLDRGSGAYAITDLPKVETSSTLPPPAGTLTNAGEFYVQTLRDAGSACPAPNAAVPCVFTMWVRVYSARAFPGGTYAGSSDVTPLTGSLAGVDGVFKLKERPLVSISTEMGSQGTLQQYCDYVKGSVC